MAHPDFTVVGGGVAGLVVARRLAAGGATVVLHESTRVLGGTVAEHTVGGIGLDAGAESFAVRTGSVAALLTELGLADDIVVPLPGSAWLQRAQSDAVPLPATSLLGIPADPLADDVVAAIGRDAAELAAARDAVPLGAVPASLGGLVRERMGAAVLDGLVGPVVRGVHSIDPDALAIERAHPRLRDALAEHGSLAGAVAGLRAAAPPGSAVAGIRGGMHRLPAALARDAERLGADLRLGSHIADPGALAGRVVLAAPGPSARRGRDITLVTLVLHAPELDAAPRGSGLLVAEGAPGIGARALTHATAKWEWLREAAEGLHVVRLSYDVDPGPRPAATARADAAALLGVELAPDAVIDVARVTWTRPAPAGGPTAPGPGGDPTAPGPGGHPEAPRPDDTAPGGRIVVGETIAGSGLAGIVAHAERTAGNLLAS